jgi:hypothetical protein
MTHHPVEVLKMHAMVVNTTHRSDTSIDFTYIPNRNGAKKGSAVYQARIFKRSWDSNINPARTGTSSTPRKAQSITPASPPQNNPPEGSHTGITTIFTKTY